MSKYIIKNCDNYTNFDEDWTCRSTIQNRKGCYCCKDITDCVMKRIVDECKNAKQRAKDYSTNAYSGGIYDEANRILELLEIEECENE